MDGHQMWAYWNKITFPFFNNIWQQTNSKRGERDDGGTFAAPVALALTSLLQAVLCQGDVNTASECDAKGLVCLGTMRRCSLAHWVYEPPRTAQPIASIHRPQQMACTPSEEKIKIPQQGNFVLSKQLCCMSHMHMISFMDHHSINIMATLGPQERPLYLLRTSIDQRLYFWSRCIRSF